MEALITIKKINLEELNAIIKIAKTWNKLY